MSTDPFGDMFNDEPNESQSETTVYFGEQQEVAHVEEVVQPDLPTPEVQPEPVNEVDPDIAAADAAIQDAEAARIQAEAEFLAADESRRNALAEAKALEDQMFAIRAAMREKQREAEEEANRNWDLRMAKQRAERAVEDARKSAEVARNNYAQRIAQQSSMAAMYAKRAGLAWNDGVGGKSILEHQWVGAQFLTSAKGAILGDGMGLGKTLTSIAALDLVDSHRALVIAQNDITTNFTREIQRWAPHRQVINLKGMPKVQRNVTLDMVVPNLKGGVIVVVNFEAWRKDLSLLTRLINQGFDTIIVDEAHNIKNTATGAYEGVKTVALNDNVCPYCRTILPPYMIQGQAQLKVQRQCPECNWQGEAFNDVETGEESRYYFTKSVKNVWAVTGTPILNAPEDLYALLSVIDPQNFNVKSRFLNTYCTMDPSTGKYTFGNGGADYLMKHRLSGRFLARTYQDAGIVLPPQDIVYHDLTLTEDDYPDQYRIVKELDEAAQLIMSDGSEMTALEEITLLLRLRQANVWAGGIKWHEYAEVLDDYGHVVFEEDMVTPKKVIVATHTVGDEVQESIKMDKAVEIIQEAIGDGRRVVLFSQFSSALEELNRRLDDLNIRNVKFDGKTPDIVKSQVKMNWDKSNGEVPTHEVLLANYKVGGTGLNLTAATVTIILDEEWNPGKRDQAYARTLRMGQDENTIVHVLRLEKTVDTWLANLISQKADLIGGFSKAANSMQEEWLKARASGELGGL